MNRRVTVAVAFALLLTGSLLAAMAADSQPPAPRPALLGHNIFFSLREPTDENKAKLVEACKSRLSQHPGVIFFAVGTRDEKLTGAFNDQKYDVALHMIFTGRDALGIYGRSSDHQKFITETTPLLKGVRIFDSAVESVENKAN